MIKVLITIAATAFLIVFGLQNSDHVPVSFVVGSPTKVRLVFLLFVAATGGFLFSYVQGLNREIMLKKEIRRLVAFASDSSKQLAVRKKQAWDGE